MNRWKNDLRDIRTVMWKERKGLLWSQGTRWRIALPLLSPLFIAIYIPWQAGTDWLEGYVSLLLCVAIPLLFVGISIPESFAGERERHTLPTLLASRLPDRAILVGKILSCVSFSIVILLPALLVGAAVANAVSWQGSVAFYRPFVLLVDLGVALLVGGLIGSAGVLISLRSETVQGATQALMGVFLVPPMILAFALMFLRDTLIPVFQRLGFATVLGCALGALAIGNGILLFLAFRRFRRTRLLLH